MLSFNPTGLAFIAGLFLGIAAMAVACWRLMNARKRRLGRFFANTIHEINAPITAANITLLNLINGTFGELGAEQSRWLDMTREQFCRLNGLMGELYDFVHLAFDQDLNLYPDKVSPAVLIQEVMAALKRSMAQSPFALQTVMPADLPQVWVDRDRTVRTLTTLFLYARKFRSSGNLRFIGERKDGAVALHLEYEGHPLPPGEDKRNLDLLYPARKRSGHVLHTVGLGLGMLKILARRQGGDLLFSVAADGRATMTLLLPVSTK